MNAQIGDVIQIDGGLVIVTSIKGDRANILPVSEFRGRRPHALDNGINVDISRDRLFERRGEAGLASFLAEQAEAKSSKRKGKIKTEHGDILCYEGRICTVFDVDDKWCSIGDIDGNVWQDDRCLNEFFFQDCTCHKLVRLNAEQRTENLKNFLKHRKSPLPETETSEVETMKTKIEKSKSSKPKSFKTCADAPVASKDDKPAKSSRSNVLFGSSICRVAMTAGSAGVTYEQFSALLEKYGLTISESTARQNLRLGKSGKATGAVLTKAQLKEFEK